MLRFAAIAAALAAGALITAPAAQAAEPLTTASAGWTVTPGGEFRAIGHDIPIGTENGTEVVCETVVLNGIANTAGNPIAVFPEVPGTEFDNCAGPLGLAVTFTHLGTWQMFGDSADSAAGVVTGRITDITVDWSAPGCAARVTGFVNFLYTNATGILNLSADRTLTVSSVDPAADCAGLVTTGEAVSVSGSFTVTPRQTIGFQ